MGEEDGVMMEGMAEEVGLDLFELVEAEVGVSTEEMVEVVVGFGNGDRFYHCHG